MTVRVTNQQKKVRIRSDALLRAAKATLRREKTPMALEVAVVDESTMKRLNKQYKGDNACTDVLAFELGREPWESDATEAEVVVCAPQARKEALRRRHSMEAELVLYVVHGTLHLLGYDDDTDKNKAKMDKRQQEIVKKLGYRLKG